VVIEARVDSPVVLDAAGTADPDGDGLKYTWFFYPEAATGIPGRPVLAARRPPPEAAAGPGQGGIPSAPAGGPRERPPRAVVEGAARPRATVIPKAPGIAHVILAVEDTGVPSLTSYRRIILNTQPAAAAAGP
jgi:hypothetical protein